jgi:succinate dehydrogenase/fumarate reductase flavoprotein subunit
MWQNVSVQRSQESLERALHEIKEYRKQLTGVAANSLRQLAEWKGLNSMLNVSEAVTRSALLRNESRGSHFRLDFPASDDSRWLGNVEICQKEKELCLAFCPKKKTGISAASV